MSITAQQWNTQHPIGTPVVAYPLTRPEERSSAFFEKLETRTRSQAWTLGHGDPVVKVDGYAGGILLAHVDPYGGTPVVGDEVVVTDTSLNFGDLHGRKAILKAVRDDEDGYNYRVALTDTTGLVLRDGGYQTWVSSIAPAQ